ncbi:NAD(P)-dependent oxidoreductase [Chelatococcus asaccharovorans]|uniref:NAD(P)-dependent oxidoreductase n=1 Tax=Chelatococcus asaccharovorans TaxID=28210 RepID=UPI00224C78BF|nr:NAD(P)-dependent oxidoreductase [Chelatococcus asaccharovorans]CAH1658025.1 4-hydroxybutyrate dehydrogenase/sulfolactaldehyde 3-reductase [Chelatococcus asaccharovorans]CAH1688885.1 4-hydroxybutyrate dehydrogenase/sulfolactaldehyde 3-reductase [Chelatococcus asaccharovorans]
MDTIGFLGLGTMGGPMARNVLRKGYSVKGFDLNRAAVEAHVAAGGQAAGSLGDLAAGCDVVITMLPDGPDVERAVLGEGGLIHAMQAGTILIDMSTIDPAVTRRVGAALAEKGILMIDSPVGKTVDHAIAGTLTLMVGGDAATIERVRPILLCMGADLFHCGGLGMGEALKLTNNFLAATILSATTEALVMGKKAGLSLELMTDVMRTTMAWNNQFAIALPKKGLAGDFTAGFMVKLGEKDQRLAVAMGKALGVETPVGAAAYATLTEARNAGFADLDVTAVLRLREEQAGVTVRLKHDA